jgi:hypothetical protein
MHAYAANMKERKTVKQKEERRPRLAAKLKESHQRRVIALILDEAMRRDSERSLRTQLPVWMTTNGVEFSSRLFT